MDIKLLDTDALVDLGDDVLLVRGVVDGQLLEAHGWVSAFESCFDPSDYDEDGHHKDGAKRRARTDAEKHEYVLALLAIAAAPTKKALSMPRAWPTAPAPEPDAS
jgi:hypothetical protein